MNILADFLGLILALVSVASIVFAIYKLAKMIKDVRGKPMSGAYLQEGKTYTVLATIPHPYNQSWLVITDNSGTAIELFELPYEPPKEFRIEVVGKGKRLKPA